MFCKGDYVVYGTSGVCLVDDITDSPFGYTENKTYYVLKPVSSTSGSAVFNPIENTAVNMRALMTENDIHRLREVIDTVETVKVELEKKRRDIYRGMLMTNSPSEWLRIIRTVGERRNAFRTAHKRLPEVDGEFENAAKSFLFNEIAIVLGTDYASAEKIVMKKMRECFPDMNETSNIKATPHNSRLTP